MTLIFVLSSLVSTKSDPPQTCGPSVLPAGARVLGRDHGEGGRGSVHQSPSDVGTGKAKDEKAPLSEIIEVLNARFGTQFSEEDRLFFQQIKEKACKSEQIVRTAMANPLDKFELGIRKLIEDLMIERMGENDKIVTRYMADEEFQGSAFTILAREIFESVRSKAPSAAEAGQGPASQR